MAVGSTKEIVFVVMLLYFGMGLSHPAMLDIIRTTPIIPALTDKVPNGRGCEGCFKGGEGGEGGSRIGVGVSGSPLPGLKGRGGVDGGVKGGIEGGYGGGVDGGGNIGGVVGGADGGQ